MTRPIVPALLAALSLATAAEPKKIFDYPYEQTDFPNGLRLITVPTDYPNIVALYIVVNTGSRNEVEPGKSGFAHFFEHMMFRGTKKYPPQKWEQIMKSAGAATNAFTSDDLTAYHATFSKESLPAILELEADRFQNLDYAESVFRTEALAVNGEYNKNSANPTSKLFEKLRDLAFDTHTYKHTTMGFLADIKAMPEQYEYSKTFFNRFYRPEYTTLLVVGDVKTAEVKAAVEKHWGGWKRGAYVAPIPKEAPQTGERKGHVEWPVPTAPWIGVGYKVPAFNDSDKEVAALQLIGSLAFGQTAPAYQRLVLQEQKVDVLFGGSQPRVDPYLFTVLSRVKKQEDVDAVRESVISTLNGLKDTLLESKRLQALKSNMRYGFAMGLDNSEAIAGTMTQAIALARTPEAYNRFYATMEQVTPEDIRNVARKYFVETGRTIVTLSGPKAK
ncbi:MAG: insulinase family protein [Acidobacteria bacterium]|nr:insulinase family protein [Acidobacteriota bacterium]